MPIPPESLPSTAPARWTERSAWFAVVAWSALIFASIPFARRLERLFGGLLGGPGGFMVLGVGAVLAGISLAAWALLRRRADRRPSGLLWLAAVAAAYLLYATRLKVPVEALHFVEYAVLGLLAYHALSFRFRDQGIHLCAILVCAIVGTVDELIQWWTPDRFGDLSDVVLNLVAAGLALVGLWKGIAPEATGARWTRRSVRTAIGLALFWMFLLLGWFSATPARLTALSSTLPGLRSMAENPSVLAEYGYLHADPEIGRFRSRFTRDQLAELDSAEWPETAAILDAFRDAASYPRFLIEHNAAVSPFAHEARVHLYRRDHFLGRWTAETDPDRRTELATIAWRENQILERAFGATLAASAYRLPPARRAALEAEADLASSYSSSVGLHLITWASESQIRWLAGLLIAALAIAYLLLGR